MPGKNLWAPAKVVQKYHLGLFCTYPSKASSIWILKKGINLRQGDLTGKFFHNLQAQQSYDSDISFLQQISQ